jgi:hypothetical protein
MYFEFLKVRVGSASAKALNTMLDTDHPNKTRLTLPRKKDGRHILCRNSLFVIVDFIKMTTADQALELIS